VGRGEKARLAFFVAAALGLWNFGTKTDGKNSQSSERGSLYGVVFGEIE